MRKKSHISLARYMVCLLYTSDAADDLLCVDIGGCLLIKKKKKDTKTDRAEETKTKKLTQR